jgi:hypothetical protein
MQACTFGLLLALTLRSVGGLTAPPPAVLCGLLLTRPTHPARVRPAAAQLQAHGLQQQQQQGMARAQRSSLLSASSFQPHTRAFNMRGDAVANQPP